MKNIGAIMGGIGMIAGGIVVIILGILFASTGVNLRAQDRNAKQTYVQAAAVVTGNEAHPYKQYQYYCAEFKFQTKDGQTISVTQNDSTSLPCSGSVSDSPYYQVGQQVSVYYDPHDPASTVLLADDMDNSAGTVIAFILGALCVMGGLVMLVVGFKWFVKGW